MYMLLCLCKKIWWTFIFLERVNWWNESFHWISNWWI